MNQGKRLTVNTICNVSVLLIQVVLGFIIAPFILDHLGRSTYGIWSLTGSLLAYSQLLSLGLNSAVNRWIPIYLVQDNHDGVNRVVNTALVAYLVAGGALTIGVLILAWGFPYWFDVEPALHASARYVVLLAGSGFLFVIVFNVFSAVLSGFQRYDLMAISDIAGDLGRIAGIVVAFLSGFGIVALALVTAAGHAVRNLLKMFFVRTQYPQLKIRLSLASWETFREMFGYSVNTLLYSCGGIIQSASAHTLIGLFLGTAAVTEYAMPAIVLNMLKQLVIRGTAAIKPATSKLDAENKLESVQKLYFAGTKYALLILLPSIGFLLAYSSTLMEVWLGEQYVAPMAGVLVTLSVASLVRLWHMPAFYVVVGLGKHRLFGLVTLWTAIGSVLSALIALYFFDAGVVGVAIAYAVPEVIAAIFVVMPYVCRIIGISVWDEVRECVVPAVLAMTPYFLILVVLRKNFSPESTLMLFVLIGALGIPILLGAWFLGLTKVERSRFLAMLPSSLNKGGT